FSDSLNATCVLLINRRPPQSALFPYTTLFRSVVDRHVERVHALDLGDYVAGPDAGVPCRRALERRDHGERLVVGGLRDHDPQAGDRKSTRLNSSHDQKSYAVFCLKNKINASVL